jgi:hypothetical protein
MTTSRVRVRFALSPAGTRLVTIATERERGERLAGV